MQRFMLALALVAVAGATYVATAPGGQTAAPTAAQFRALKAQVTKLQKDEVKVKNLALAEAVLLTDCMTVAKPVALLGDGSATGFQYWNGSGQSLRVGYIPTAADDPNATFLTGGGAQCGSDLTPALRKLARFAGVRLP
jgi:hypothetical protein